MLLPESALQSPAQSQGCGLPTLLIVGDPNGLNVAREALIELELGWEVVFAGSAFDALDVPAVREIDVIMVDLGNPNVEGVDLVESLHARFPHTPIVLMSAPYAVSVALECLQKGAVNHFPRDLLDTEPAAVLETLRAAARQHQRRRAAWSASTISTSNSPCTTTGPTCRRSLLYWPRQRSRPACATVPRPGAFRWRSKSVF